MLERLMHWKTTGGGLAITAGMIILNSFGCQLPNDWKMWTIMVAPAVVGAVLKGKK